MAALVGSVLRSNRTFQPISILQSQALESTTGLEQKVKAFYQPTIAIPAQMA
jgi:hypothetical protein